MTALAGKEHGLQPFAEALRAEAFARAGFAVEEDAVPEQDVRPGPGGVVLSAVLPGRLQLIVSLLHTVRTGVRDDVVTMFRKRIAAIHKKGRDQLEALRELHRAESERLLGVFGDVLDGVREATTPAEQQPDDQAEAGAAGGAPGDVAERAGRLVLKALEQAGGLEALAAAHEAVSAHHGNNNLPLLDQHYRSHRSALFTLVESIDLESTNADRSVLDAVEYLKAQRNARAAFVPDPKEWQRPLRHLATRHHLLAIEIIDPREPPGCSVRGVSGDVRTAR